MPNLYLAPMAGITDQVFRRLCFEQGCDGATTEMVSAQGYLTAPPDRSAYRFLLARFPEEGPLAVQIFGSEPLFMAQAAATGLSLTGPKWQTTQYSVAMSRENGQWRIKNLQTIKILDGN